MPSLASRIEEVASAIVAERGREQERADRHFRQLLEMLGPRIRYLGARYGLSDMREDAWQACALGIHRALLSYEPGKASFSTHATWQMRGELQSLRHRVRLDQRDSAKAAGITTVAIEGLRQGEARQLFEIVDDEAQPDVERAASDHLAYRSISALLDRLEATPSDRSTMLAALFGDSPLGATREQREKDRQVVRRLSRNCRKLVAG
ncbi:sigma factor [Erythrobacter sp. HKB08]|uniref:sigma factor n=1 Tax=Erythrobacter sp. HKB08 TaxID=2502843 RepID=UPI001008E93C|nr:sigma factor [Erythrobacter sp. HKB08]